MSELLRTMVICGFISATEPFTAMGLLLMMTSHRPRQNGIFYLLGVFTIETAILVFSAMVLGGLVDTDSSPGHFLLALRVVAGIALVVLGLRLRKPAKKPEPEVPKIFDRIRGVGPLGAFVAGIALADYQGPIIGSLALVSSDVGRPERLLAVLVFTVIATGIPMFVYFWALRSETAREKLQKATNWVMSHRRQIASWFCIILGTLLAGDAAIGLALGI